MPMGIDLSVLVKRATALYEQLSELKDGQKDWITYVSQTPDMDAVAILLYMKQQNIKNWGLHILPMLEPNHSEITISKVEPE